MPPVSRPKPGRSVAREFSVVSEVDSFSNYSGGMSLEFLREKKRTYTIVWIYTCFILLTMTNIADS